MTYAKHTTGQRRDFRLGAIAPGYQVCATLLVIAGFLFDYLTPLGVAGGLIYTAVVLCALWGGTPGKAYLYAAAGSTLTVLGYVIFHRIGIHEWIVLTNRALTIVALWTFAFIVARQKSIQISLERKQSELAAIQDNTVEGMISAGSDGTIHSYNRACVEIFGYSAQEAIGKNLTLLMPEPYRAEHGSYLQHYRRSGEKKIIGTIREVEGLRKDGSIFPLELSVSEIRSSGLHLFSGIVRDITSKKQAEAENDRLIQDLSRSNRDLDDFAYVASHDLRAPLRVIANAARWLEEDLDPMLDEDSRENLQLMLSRVSRMERLLDDLHEYARAGRKTDATYKQLVSGQDLIREVLLLVDKPQGFTITTDPGFSSLQVPVMPLKQVFTNLISNAIKHSETGTGLIRLSARECGTNYEFSVADDGPGIDPQFHEQVFKMFKTLKSRDAVEGSGIGLALVKKHVDQAGGAIALHSAPGEGCEVRFTWPKHARPAAAREDGGSGRA